jgi:hypothetical protein
MAIPSLPSCAIMNCGRTGAMQPAVIYDRAKLRAGDVIPGPAIVM